MSVCAGQRVHECVAVTWCEGERGIRWGRALRAVRDNSAVSRESITAWSSEAAFERDAVQLCKRSTQNEG